MESRNLKQLLIVLTVMVAGISLVPTIQGADYILGAEDELDISFWQDPALNTQVRVGLDGKITLDIIGQMEAAGKTTTQLEDDIVRLISRLNKNISQATVRVVAFNHNYVFVIGQANQPGKQTFEEIPDIWTVINEAGGVTELGDLDRIIIIRGGDQAGEVEVVNLREALATGQLDQLPRLRRGDTIEIGRAPGQVLAGEIGPMAEKKNLFYVIGAVGVPGAIAYEENVDVFEAIALAGGPTELADLKRTQLIIKDGNYAQSVNINLEKYMKTGQPARYIMKKEDMIIIPPRHPGFFETRLGQIAGLLTAISTAYLLADRIQGD
jgi:polysaccharide export outer membrane protein